YDTSEPDGCDDDGDDRLIFVGSGKRRASANDTKNGMPVPSPPSRASAKVEPIPLTSLEQKDPAACLRFMYNLKRNGYNRVTMTAERFEPIRKFHISTAHSFFHNNTTAAKE